MSRMALLFVYDPVLHHEETIRSVLTDKTTRSHRLRNSKLCKKSSVSQGGGPGAVVQEPAWKVGDRGIEHRSSIQVSKKQTVSSPLTRKDSIVWGAPVTGK